MDVLAPVNQVIQFASLNKRGASDKAMRIFAFTFAAALAGMANGKFGAHSVQRVNKALTKFVVNFQPWNMKNSTFCASSKFGANRDEFRCVCDQP